MARIDEEKLDPKQAAKALGVHVYTVYALLRTRALKGYKINTHWKIPRSSVEEFINRTRRSK